MTYFEYFETIKEEIISIRREIHKNPELGFNEINTSSLICKTLDKYNIKYTNQIAGTGVCAIVGNNTDKVLLVRADMDALPIDEKTNLPYASVNSGIMHACGHDFHIASVLAAAIILKKYEEHLKGTVKFVFQPAEETTGGAKPMIDAGIMDNPTVTACIAGHVSAEYETGKVYIKSGALMASPDDFSVTFIGKSTHGATPENGISPILPATKFVTELYEKINPLCNGGNVMSVCTIKSEGGVNTIPDKAQILGTFRSYDEHSRNEACNLIGQLAQDIAKSHKVQVEYKYNFLYPPVINDELLTEKFYISASESIGKENVCYLDKPLMTGDDFAYFGKDAPAVYFWYGGMKNTSCPLHSSNLDIDEKALEVAVKVFCDFAQMYFGKENEQ